MDLPAPVSPVNTDRPDWKSRSSHSIRTISRIDNWTSMARTSGPDQLRPGARNPGATIFARFHAAGLQQLVGIRVPLAVRIVASEHGSSRLRLLDNAHGVLGLHETSQCLLDLRSEERRVGKECVR